MWERRGERIPSLSPRYDDATQAVVEQDIRQGRIFWLPPRDSLHHEMVRRAHGKGSIEQGIYNHPVVIISRPGEEPNIVHFHVITSFQGKRLEDIYPKANDFHAGRRAWFLPLSPSPPHPDAVSKNTSKRFPLLSLSGGASLRWHSYVNIRHVFKVEWTALRPYVDPGLKQEETRTVGGPAVVSLDRVSMTRMLSRGKALTQYEPGAQAVTAPAAGGRRQPSESTLHEDPRTRSRDRDMYADPTASREGTSEPKFGLRRTSHSRSPIESCTVEILRTSPGRSEMRSR